MVLCWAEAAGSAGLSSPTRFICLWCRVLLERYAGSGGRSRSTQLCGTPHDRDPNVPTLMLLPGQAGGSDLGGRRGNEHLKPNLHGWSDPKALRTPAGHTGPVAKGSASRKGCRRQVISIHPVRNPAGWKGVENGEATPHPRCSRPDRTGLVALASRKLKAHGPSSPGGNSMGGGQMGKVRRQLRQHRPGTNSRGPTPAPGYPCLAGFPGAGPMPGRPASSSQSPWFCQRMTPSFRDPALPSLYLT